VLAIFTVEFKLRSNGENNVKRCGQGDTSPHNEKGASDQNREAQERKKGFITSDNI
jgi:hypothetical protein